MPQAIGLLVFAAIGNFGGIATWIVTSSIAASLIGGLGVAALSIGANYLLSASNQPAVPKSSDGKYNLKQNVPDLCRVYGRVKKGGDYLFLEEVGGVAFHIICIAAHKIHSVVSHWLHDEEITLNSGTGQVVGPGHFYPYVYLDKRLGADASTAYGAIVSAFPSIWTTAHRGDGLATVLLSCATVAAEDYQTVYPQQMPVHTAIIEGAEVYDPRSGVTAYSQNLALIRLDHLMHPSGGAKLSAADMDMASWARAADVCDEYVLNRAGGYDRRYHGGLWYRYSNDQVQVGRLIDQAAELVIYETAEGKVAVHAGEYVAPDIRLTETDLLSVSFKANRSKASTVLAVRGRFTDPASNYNTVDAATYGNPYLSLDDQRTKTLDNQVVQVHNHSARLQKLAFIRANAPRVTLVATYEAARNAPYRRFIKVHRPPLMVEAIIEILDRPKLSLATLTYEISGIVVPANLYDFVAATEEGVAGTVGTILARGDIPDPVNFGISIETADLGGGQTAAYAKGTWDHVSDALTYELEWSPTAGGVAQSVLSTAGQDEVSTGYLSDGVEYQFRLRTWSAASSSAYTAYIDATATADPTAPGLPTSASATGGVGQATVDWTTPNSANFASTRVYRNTTNSFGTASLVDAIYSAASSPRSYVDTGLTVGTYYYWLTSANFSGIESSEVATGSVTVT
ncbi:hypothetical protein C3941_23790 [Kaistia algarum]|uniref:hypothetical protein n=1 Tax=Kaistia algarum TaxID=2083279 RepID=UPI000CE8C37C|nr:hypothetical protein [Kaistia algarum]MCX5513414.1 hypothetical protein [Kaistia algarum]PPE77421.1 hypothetical protein C3941_23790 [Kaistia algarum]